MYHGDLEENRMTRIIERIIRMYTDGDFFYPSLFFQKIRRL